MPTCRAIYRYLPIYHPTDLTTYHPMDPHPKGLPSYISNNLQTCQPINLLTYQHTDLTTHRPTKLQTHQSTDIRTCRPMSLLICQPTDQPTYWFTILQTNELTDLQIQRCTNLQTYNIPVCEPTVLILPTILQTYRPNNLLPSAHRPIQL